MISIRNLTKKYGDKVVLDNFSHEFKNKGITFILGESGSGKSTLFNLLAGFDRDYEGKIVLGEKDISEFSQNELADYRKTRIGFVFQDYNLIQGYTVFENIMLAAELNNNGKEENEVLVRNLIEYLGIRTKLEEKVENLSGGQKQRVAIARALINQPAVVLADEPTGALDQNAAIDIMELFSEIAKEKPVIIITHNERDCVYADEVLRIVDGRPKVLKYCNNFKEEKNSSYPNQNNTPVSLRKIAIKNFKNHFRKYVGMALAVAVGVSSILLSFSSQNVISNKIEKFKEKNTTFAYGQIQLDDKITLQKIEQVIKGNQNIAGYYLQYAIPESYISIREKTINFTPKEFGSVSNEVMNIGVMPQSNEIAITPSVAKKMSNDLKSLIGEKVIFTCDNFSKELTISGIFNSDFDNFYLGEDVEQELYLILNSKDPVSLSYKAKGFNEVLLIEKQLNQVGVLPITASKQVKSFKTTFENLRNLFVIISIFIMAITLFISGMLVLKITNIRTKEMGILMALGYGTTQIKQMLIFENLLVSSVAIIITLLIITGSMAVAKIISITLLLSSINIIFAIFFTFIIISALALFASNRLLKTDPAEVLRK